MKRIRKPEPFCVKGELGNKVEMAWCYQDNGERWWATEFIHDLDVRDAVRFSEWLRKALLWLEKDV